MHLHVVVEYFRDMTCYPRSTSSQGDFMARQSTRDGMGKKFSFLDNVNKEKITTSGLDYTTLAHRQQAGRASKSKGKSSWSFKLTNF